MDKDEQACLKAAVIKVNAATAPPKSAQEWATAVTAHYHMLNGRVPDTKELGWLLNTTRRLWKSEYAT